MFRALAAPLVVLMLLARSLPCQEGAKGANKTASSTQQQRGSDSLPIAVKLLNTGESKEQARENTARIDVEKDVAETTLFWTRVLGASTIVLAIATILLWFATRGTLSHLRKEFLAAHRPRLIVRRVIFSGSVEEGVPVDVHVEIANIGESKALVTKFAVALEPFMLTQPKPAAIVGLIETGLRPIPDENRLVGNGDSLVVVVPATDTIAHALGVNRAEAGLYRLLCVGYVEYTNVLGEHRRRAGFVRQGNFDTEYFDGVKELSAFEYAD